MPGTVIESIKLTKVVDGDTVKVEIDGKAESLRLCCLDTEESWPGGSKPVTNAGKKASKWAKQYFSAGDDGLPAGEVRVNLEFDTNDPLNVCLKKHRGNYGRLICYIYKGAENYNLKAVAEGWSPYFVKYGRSRLHHSAFLAAEAKAQSENLAIWDPATNEGGETRDYRQLLPWWHMRAGVVQDYRKFGLQSGAKSVRLDYDDIVEAAKQKNNITVFCDLQSGINKWTHNGALIYAGSPHHKFNLWIPDADTEGAAGIIRLIEKRYEGFGRGYVYVSGQSSLWPPNENGKPQMVITDKNQLSDLPPGDGEM